MFYLVDSDQFPVWLEPVDKATASEWIARGDASSMMPAEPYQLTWASRHGAPARWYIFPR